MEFFLRRFFPPSFWRYFTHKWHTFSCVLFLTIIYVRIRESSYHLGCFFLIEYSKLLFQSINSDYNTNEMATGSTYKGEVHPFAGESKFWRSLKLKKKNFILKLELCQQLRHLFQCRVLDVISNNLISI
jgi:hypothetical protein